MLLYCTVTQQSERPSSESSVLFICCHGRTSVPKSNHSICTMVLYIPSSLKILLLNSSPLSPTSSFYSLHGAILTNILTHLTFGFRKDNPTPSSYKPFTLLPFTTKVLKIWSELAVSITSLSISREALCLSSF